MNDVADHFACMKCGIREHIELLDAKAPPGHPNPDNADFEHFECIACYGPGWETNVSSGRMQALSIAPSLKAAYVQYFLRHSEKTSS